MPCGPRSPSSGLEVKRPAVRASVAVEVMMMLHTVSPDPRAAGARLVGQLDIRLLVAACRLETLAMVRNLVVPPLSPWIRMTPSHPEYEAHRQAAERLPRAYREAVERIARLTDTLVEDATTPGGVWRAVDALFHVTHAVLQETAAAVSSSAATA